MNWSQKQSRSCEKAGPGGKGDDFCAQKPALKSQRHEQARSVLFGHAPRAGTLMWIWCFFGLFFCCEQVPCVWFFCFPVFSFSSRLTKTLLLFPVFCCIQAAATESQIFEVFFKFYLALFLQQLHSSISLIFVRFLFTAHGLCPHFYSLWQPEYVAILFFSLSFFPLSLRGCLFVDDFLRDLFFSNSLLQWWKSTRRYSDDFDEYFPQCLNWASLPSRFPFLCLLLLCAATLFSRLNFFSKIFLFRL